MQQIDYKQLKSKWETVTTDAKCWFLFLKKSGWEREDEQEGEILKILNCTLGSSDEKQAQYTKGYEQLRDR